jgi:hypothetical protein
MPVHSTFVRTGLKKQGGLVGLQPYLQG